MNVMIFFSKASVSMASRNERIMNSIFSMLVGYILALTRLTVIAASNVLSCTLITGMFMKLPSNRRITLFSGNIPAESSMPAIFG